MSHCAASNRGSGSERTACKPFYDRVVEINGIETLFSGPASVAGRKPFVLGQTLSPRALPRQKQSGQSPPLLERIHRRRGKPLQAHACQNVAGLAIAGEVPGGKLRQFDRFGLEACGEDGCQLSERGFDDFPKRILELVAQTFNLGVPHDVAQPLVAAGQHRREELFDGPEVVVQVRQEF